MYNLSERSEKCFSPSLSLSLSFSLCRLFLSVTLLHLSLSLSLSLSFCLKKREEERRGRISSAHKIMKASRVGRRLSAAGAASVSGREQEKKKKKRKEVGNGKKSFEFLRSSVREPRESRRVPIVHGRIPKGLSVSPVTSLLFSHHFSPSNISILSFSRTFGFLNDLVTGLLS